MNTFVKKIIYDIWDNMDCDEAIIIFPTCDDVKKIIKLLDEKRYTLMSLYGDDGSYISIGGGNGKYVVYVSTTDNSLWNLLSKDNDKKTILLNIGGQKGDFFPYQIVNKEDVLQAACIFFESGRLDLSLHWEKQK